MKGRIAPTPSGYLHLGNGVNFVLTWLLVRSHKETLRLRIDDLDTERIKGDFIEDIFQALKWLGLDIDEGPSGVQDFKDNYSQHLRYDRYQSAFESLKLNSSLYVCECSRSQISQRCKSGVYDGLCATKNLTFIPEKTSWRIDTDSFKNVSKESTLNQAILWTKRNRPSYQMACVVDEELDGITDIVRGIDLWESSLLQQHLSAQLGYQSKINYYHHPLILDEDTQEKLAKTDGSQSLKSMQEDGDSPLFVFQLVASMIRHPNPFPRSLKDLLVDFDYVKYFDSV